MPTEKKPPNRDAGAAGAFAFALYELWVAAGSPTLRSMGERTNISHSSLSRAMKGHRVPSWENVRAFVTACDVDPESWKSRWRDAKAAEAAEKKAVAAVNSVIRSGQRTGGTKTSAMKAVDERDSGHSQPRSAPPRQSVVGHVGIGVRELPRLRLPLKEGIAEHLSTSVLREVLEMARVQGTPLHEALARMLGCDADVAVECLIHSMIALRVRNDRLLHRLAWATPSSEFLPAHLLPPVGVQLVPSSVVDGGAEDRLRVVGTSSRPPGAHHRSAAGESTRNPWLRRRPRGRHDLPSAESVDDAAARHSLEDDAVVRSLPTRRTSVVETSAQAEPASEATGTDALQGAIATSDAVVLSAPGASCLASPTASVSTLSIAPPAVDIEVTRRASPARTNTGEEGPVSLVAAQGPWLLRHQLGIKVSMLWFVALAVCVSMLFTPRPSTTEPNQPGERQATVG